MALPVGGAFLGGLVHYSKVLRGIPKEEIATVANWKYGHLPTAWHSIPGVQNVTNILHELPQTAAIGAAIGLALAAPFLPGMIGDRKTADERRRIYSGEQLVPVRQGRFWEMGPTPWQGGRIKYFRPHWFAAMKAHAEDASLYGSEQDK